MKRITTNDENHILASLNMFYCRDGEVWVRHGGPEPDYPDATLVDVIREIAKAHDLVIEAEGPESLGDEMYDAMFDGVSTVEGVVALFHAAAVQAAEMQGRLKAIEDILGDEYELDRLRELVEADREGRVRIIAGPKPKEAVCGNCGNFIRIPGTRTGVCKVQSFYRDQHGKEEPRRGKFSPSQSRKACRNFLRAEAALRREQE